MLAGVELFPVTLLHGDAYGANVIAGGDGASPRLIDWGNPRIGPAMIDVAMSTDYGSSGCQAYLDTWEAVAGRAMDPWLAEAGHAWATALTNAMFVGAVAKRIGPEAAQVMLDRTQAALDRFGETAASGHLSPSGHNAR